MALIDCIMWHPLLLCHLTHSAELGQSWWIYWTELFEATSCRPPLPSRVSWCCRRCNYAVHLLGVYQRGTCARTSSYPSCWVFMDGQCMTVHILVLLTVNRSNYSH